MSWTSCVKQVKNEMGSNGVTRVLNFYINAGKAESENLLEKTTEGRKKWIRQVTNWIRTAQLLVAD